MAKVTRTPGPGRKQLDAMIAGLKDKQTKVGFMESSKYPDGTPVAYVAAIQEFGDPSHSIPPRPFLRPTVTRESGKWRTIAASGAKAVARGTRTMETVLDALGQMAAGGVRQSISQVQSPPLSLVTLRLRYLSRQGDTIGGKTVGQAFRDVNFVGPRIKGDKLKLSTNKKPLVFDGILIGAVTSVTEDIQ